MSTEGEHKTAIWPWIVLGILNICTFAPSGISKVLGFAEGFNRNGGIFITSYCVIFIALFIAAIKCRRKNIRSATFMTALALFILNFGGCAAIWSELAGIN